MMSYTMECTSWCVSGGTLIRRMSPWIRIIGGKPAEHYQWAEKVLRIITMSVTDFYADISDKQHAVPLLLSETLEPLGRVFSKAEAVAAADG